MSELVNLRTGLRPEKREPHPDGDDDDFNSVANYDSEEHNYPHGKAGYTSVVMFHDPVNTNPDSATNPEMPDAQKLNRQASEMSTTERSNKQQANSELDSFVQKKSFAQNMMDIALLSANTNQLRYVIDLGDKHPYYGTSMILISLSLVMQIIVGLSMVYLNSYNMKNKTELKAASALNNVSVAGVFLVTLVNVFISTFNGAGAEMSSGGVGVVTAGTEGNSTL